MQSKSGEVKPSLRQSTEKLFRDLGHTLSISRRTPDASAKSEDPAITYKSPDRKPSLNVTIPSTSILSPTPQIVVGVLYKYVNITSGWRPRLFVLHGGVLRYYKIYGPTAININTLLDTLRQEGQLYPIGAEISLLESRVRVSSVKDSSTSVNGQHHVVGTGGNGRPSAATKPSPNSTNTSGSSLASPLVPGAVGQGSKVLPAANAEVHLQVATIYESSTDSRVFLVNSGTATLRLRAECKEDRWIWVEVLKKAKNAWQGLTPTAVGALHNVHSGRVRDEDDEFLERLANVRETLIQKETPSAAVTYIENILTADHQKYHDMLVAEEDKRRTLLDMVLALENEKLQLETALIVEGRQQSSLKPRRSDASVAPGLSEIESPTASDSEVETAGPSMTEPLLDDEEGNESDIEDYEFHECESGAAAVSGGSSMSPSHSRAGSAAGMVVAGSAASTDIATALDKLTASSSEGQEMVLNKVPSPDWLSEQDFSSPPPRRDRLPVPAQRERSVSLWALIKEMVGKDLTRVCLPVYFNEPLSALQKTAEDLEYSELLDEAFRYPAGSAERLLRVAAFAISAYSSTVGRTAKPFNPLLGETYELVYPEKGFRFIGEKVSHHPTIIAAQAEGRSWVFEGDAEVKSRFWGRSIELHPVGVLRLTFSDGDSYSWNKVVTSINNLILGKIYVDHGGIMKVKCHSPGGMTARIKFKETGMLFDKDPRVIHGVLERDGVKFAHPFLHGHWDDELHAHYADGTSVRLWKKAPPPPEPTRYNLTAFSIKLNELTPGLKDKLAPTDSRLRPDQSCTEQGMWDEANSEKQRLEHKQRAARKAAERGEPLHPRWFKQLHATGGSSTVSADGVSGSSNLKTRHADELAFKYRGGYWEERAKGEFTGCRDIFGPMDPEENHVVV